MPNSDRVIRIGLWPAFTRGSNPFVDLFAKGLREAGAQTIDFDPLSYTEPLNFDILHIHWPEQIFWSDRRWKVLPRLFKVITTFRKLKKNGVKFVWMVHNIAPHDLSRARRPLWLFYRYSLYRFTDGFLTLSPGTIGQVRDELTGLKTKPADFVWHPTFVRVTLSKSRSEIRSRLGFNESNKVFALLGLLRPYKGIEALMTAFSELPDVNARLLLVGEPISPEYGKTILRCAALDRRIEVHPRHVSAALFAEYLSAADMIVLPFQKTLHSGSIVHALSEHRPVLTIDTPFSASLKNKIGQGWITTYKGQLQTSDLSDVALPTGAPELDAFSTFEAGKRAVAFYTSIMALDCRAKGAGVEQDGS